MDSDHQHPEISRVTAAYLMIFGAGIIVLATILVALHVTVVGIYYTPVVWTGYFLFVDSWNFRRGARSYLFRDRKELLVMIPWSIFCWLIFEAYNLHMQNWEYVGLPDNITARLIGYAWSFATIFPVIWVTYNAVSHSLQKISVPVWNASSRLLTVHFTTGILFVLVPLFLPSHIAAYLFAFVWMGFVFVLEPVNDRAGGRSLYRSLRQGNAAPLVSLFTAGLICGFLWEFWNTIAFAGWMYDVPVPFAGPKLFEMPLLGYLGFLPFAVECFSMQNFLLVILRKAGIGIEGQ